MGFEELLGRIGAVPEADLPELVGALARAQALALARLVAGRPAAAPAGQQPSRWLTPEEAAAIAGIPAKRVYEWARGKRWASRPTRRCLRVNESEFRRWLASR